MRVLKWALWLVGSVLLLLLVAVAGIVLFFDPNDHRDRIVAAVEEQTGRDFTLDGKIEWSLFPWLSITAGPIRLGNDPAFSGDEFLSAREVAAELRLWPLLQRKVKVGAVRLQQPQLVLQVNESGRGNWDSLAERSTADADAGEESAVELSIDTIRLRDAVIDYQDVQAGTRFRLSDLDLEASPVRADAPMEVELSADYRSEPFEGRVAGEVTISGLLDDGAPRISMPGLSLTSTVEPRFELELTQTALLDLEAGSLELPGFSFSSYQATGSGSLSGAALTGDPRLEGRLDTARFDLGAWLRATGLYAEATADPAALSAFEAGFTWSMSDATIAIDKLDATLDDSRIEGSARIGEEITFELGVDRLNADRYLPPESEDGDQADDPTVVEVDFGLLRGTLKVAELVLAGLTATDVTLTLESDENGLRLMPIAGRLYGGTVKANIDLATGAAAGLTARAKVADAVWMDPAPLRRKIGAAHDPGGQTGTQAARKTGSGAAIRERIRSAGRTVGCLEGPASRGA